MTDPLLAAIPSYYPVNDFGPFMKGMVIGGLGILHVFLAQFAIGGGMLLCYFEWLDQHGREPHARAFTDGFFKVLVLISFVLGALTGVGMWFTSIQVSARTIGLMIDQFHWLWAVEWCFFALEITAGYLFYRYGSRLPGRVRMRLLSLYALSAWFSLFWINGILSWQLTPGAWLETRSIWAGFFNPSFFPSLVFRTVVAMTLGGLVALMVISAMRSLEREARTRLQRRAGQFLAPMVLMPFIGAWFLGVIPDDSRSWLLGGSIAMTLFLAMAVGASAIIAGYVIIGLLRQHMYINIAAAAVLLVLALTATAGGEFVREGSRKPFTVRQALYANSITPGEIADLRARGSVTGDPYPLRRGERYPNPQLRLGARVHRLQCSVCHTVAGANGLVHLAGSWTPEQLRMNIAKLQHTKAFMPPFAGDARELEALVQMIMWESAGAPDTWPESNDRAILLRIDQWLEQAGTEPGTARRYRKAGEARP